MIRPSLSCMIDTVALTASLRKRGWMHSLSWPLKTMESFQTLFGFNDQFIRVLEQEFSVKVLARDGRFHFVGEPAQCAIAEKLIAKLGSLIDRDQTLDTGKVRYLAHLAKKDQLDLADEVFHDTVAFTYKGRRITCKTIGQGTYIRSIRENPLTLAIGPAGTGKTYLAIAMAVVALRTKQVERIILTRPAVEAGEKLGFLPGDMAQKVDPFLRPLYDALFDIIGSESYQGLIEKGTLEVAPLAFMRGRTLSRAFIILDEAQNTTAEQMKMFLTRIGLHSRCVVAGDLTQVDLPTAKKPGLTIAAEVLQGLEGVGIVRLDRHDVVRNELVQRIVAAYDAYAPGGNGTA